MENTETQDQVSEDTQAQAEEQVSSEQSETTSEQGTEQKVYTLNTVEGEKEFKTMDELYEYTQKLSPGFTRVSQENAELKRKLEEREATAQEAARQSIEQNELLENVDPKVQEAILQIVQPAIAKALQAKEIEAQQKAQDEAFKAELDRLEEKYPGGDGKPKFDKTVVLAAMRDPNNRIYDPEVKFYQMNKDKIDDWTIQQALKQKSGGIKTERTGGDTERKPETKTPRSFEEAGQAFLNRLRAS